MDKETGLVLYYGLKDEKEERRLLALLDSFALAGRRVAENQLGLSIASLLEPASTAWQNGTQTKELPPLSVLLLHRMTDTVIRDLLAQARQEGLQIDLKAVVTEHNLNWTFAGLAAELQKEDLFMRQLAALNRMIRQAEDLLGQGRDPKQLDLAVTEAKNQLAAARTGEDFKQADFIKAGRQLAALLQEKET